MLWRRKDMGSDPMQPIFVQTDVPTIVDDRGAEFVQVQIPVAAYKRLVDWASLGRTLGNAIGCLADGSPDEDRTHLAYEELTDLEKALCEVHGAIRQHYITLPGKEIVK